LKLLFYANLAPQLTKRLAGLYPGSAHVRDLALRADRAIWDFAASDGFVIVSTGNTQRVTREATLR